LFLGYIGPLQVLLPNQVQDIDSAHKALRLGIVTGIGAAVALVTGPAAGALSDATGSRFGRRRPWIAGGAVAGAAGLALLSGQRTILGVTIAWCVAQAGLNCMQAGVTALVPDRVPVTQRGAVSGWSGLSQTIGVIVAVVLVSDLITGRVPAYLALGGLVMAAAVPILRAPDPPVPREQLPVFEARAVVRAFRFSPRRYPDFSWAWATRFLVQLGNSMTILYLLYFLRDKVRYQQLFPGHKAEQGLLILIVIYTLATVATVVIGALTVKVQVAAGESTQRSSVQSRMRGGRKGAGAGRSRHAAMRRRPGAKYHKTTPNDPLNDQRHDAPRSQLKDIGAERVERYTAPQGFRRTADHGTDA